MFLLNLGVVGDFLSFVREKFLAHLRTTFQDILKRNNPPIAFSPRLASAWFCLSRLLCFSWFSVLQCRRLKRKNLEKGPLQKLGS